MKYYKFKMLIPFKDDESSKEYYPEGVVSSINYEQFLKDEKLTVMWKSFNNIAYETTIRMEDISLYECTKSEYDFEFKNIDYENNNNLYQLLNSDSIFLNSEYDDSDYSLFKEKSKPVFKLIKDED